MPDTPIADRGRAYDITARNMAARLGWDWDNLPDAARNSLTADAGGHVDAVADAGLLVSADPDTVERVAEAIRGETCCACGDVEAARAAINAIEQGGGEAS